jgi:hypothetical protein
MKTWIVVIVLALVAAVAWKEMNPGGGLRLPGSSGALVNTLAPTSPHYAQQQEFIDRFNADPELRDRFAGSFSSKGLYAEVTFALARGAQSLDGPSLVRVTRAMAAVIPRLPEKSCAKLVRERDDFDRELSRDIDDALARLPAAHHRNLWDFYLRALKAEVDGMPIRPVDEEHLQVALQELGGNYNGREAARMQAVMRNPDDAADADACWAINTMTFGATQLSPQSAEAMARLIWAGGR